MKIYENALPKIVYDSFKQLMHSGNFPWVTTATNRGQSKKFSNSTLDHSLCHLVYYDNQKVSPYASELLNAIYGALDKYSIPVQEIIRIRIGMLPALQEKYTNHPHVDSDYSHNVGLIYFDSSNSETIIYNEKYPYETFEGIIDPEQYIDSHIENFTVMERVMPLDNRMIIFNGEHYHSSTRQTDEPWRITLNFNFV